MALFLAQRTKIGSKRNPLRQRILQHLSVGYVGWLVAAASSLATATVTSATPVSAAAVTSSATAATTGWPLLARSRFIHSHRPPVHGMTVEFRDGILRFLI